MSNSGSGLGVDLGPYSTIDQGVWLPDALRELPQGGWSARCSHLAASAHRCHVKTYVTFALMANLQIGRAGKSALMPSVKHIIAITTVTHIAQAKHTGISPWAVVVTASVIIGIVAGVIGVLSYINYYRQRRVDREIIEIAKSNVGAKDAEKSKRETEQEVQQLKGLRDKLSRQISQLPGEANRLFLERQLEELVRNISKDFKEYETIKTRLQSAATSSTLDPQIRRVIKSSILPVQKERERRNGYILLTLILLLALNLSPVRISDYVWKYFNALSDSPEWTMDSPAWMIAFGSIAIAVLFWCAYSLIPKFQKYVLKLRWTALVITSAGLLISLIILGYNFRDEAAGLACSPVSCGYPPVPYTAAGIAFNLAPICGGLFLFLIFKLRPKIFSVFTRLRTHR